MRSYERNALIVPDVLEERVFTGRAELGTVERARGSLLVDLDESRIKRSSLGRQIGSLPQESIGDDELAVSVPRMRSGTINHSAKKPVAIQRGDSSQLIVAGPPDVAEVLGQRAVTV
jgi:hypothetical protein